MLKVHHKYQAIVSVIALPLLLVHHKYQAVAVIIELP